jgi:hypothetical protein
MQHLINYKKFNESNKPVVSFDFDGVLHTSMVPGTLHPINFTEPDTWEPNHLMHDILRQEQNNNTIIIVTARDTWNKPEIEYFLRKYNLSVDEIITTDELPKKSFLLSHNAIKHYDDNINLLNELKGTGIEFVLVVEGKPTEKIIL